MESAANNEGMYIPVCDEALKPMIGMKFKPLVEGVEFYEHYARSVGFGIWKQGYKSVHGIIKWQYLTSSRQGSKKFIPGHASKSSEVSAKKRRCRSFRCECLAKLNLSYFSDDMSSGYEIGSHGKLTKLFWADVISRRNYHMFGDVVSFDSTYNTNRYCMIFAPFTGKDNHSRTVTFGAGLLSNEDPDEFDMIWNDLMERAVRDQRNVNSRLNYLDYSAIPVLSTQLSIEKHASTIYTDSIFKDVQQKISNGLLKCEMVSISVEDNIKMYKVKDQYDITWWLKSSLLKAAHGLSSEEQQPFEHLDEKQEVKKKLYSNFYRLVQKTEGSMDHLSLLNAGLYDLEEHIFGNGAVPSVIEKKKMVEDFYGMSVPDVIDVHPPDVVSTKGSGTDRVSRRETAIKKSNKPLRRCGKCHELGHHDSRNCGRVNGKTRTASTSQA
ncbi:protein FAR1-RELATED SEQUENCE 5-like [Salvia divinorum]|uniref:Protein FAR1-RELATED SEQUENCE 5-like n=1 Tax=Salvia divinorum TaxID=28513 RepID=A0ABD1I982_SALDI